jgi:hypothetical protein
MKIFFFNIDRGRKKDSLLNYFKSLSGNTDVFCFQEYDAFIDKELKRILNNFNFFNDIKIFGKEVYNNATYVNKNIDVVRKTLLDTGLDVGCAQKFFLKAQNVMTVVCNVHGIPYPGDKLDNIGRIRQSNVIIKECNNTSAIIGGDFNLLPDTESVRLFENNGYKNLIKEFNIKSTRSSFAWQQALENHKSGVGIFGKQEFSDYVFVTSDIDLKNFEVSSIETSDHLPMILNI